jgi:hypothetical protein
VVIPFRHGPVIVEPAGEVVMGIVVGVVRCRMTMRDQLVMAGPRPGLMDVRGRRHREKPHGDHQPERERTASHWLDAR